MFTKQSTIANFIVDIEEEKLLKYESIAIFLEFIEVYEKNNRTSTALYIDYKFVI